MYVETARYANEERTLDVIGNGWEETFRVLVGRFREVL
jgi:hypothetical protein